MGVFRDKPEQVEHTITQTWRAGHETADFIRKIHGASCTCGWTSPEGGYQQMLMAVGAHEAAAEQGAQTPGLAAAFTPTGIA